MQSIVIKIIFLQVSNMSEIYTDGSCLGNPGVGGWAGHCEGHFTICGGEEPNTTNNIMELTAVIRSLIKAHMIGLRSVKVFTDSAYVKNGITKWVYNWEQNNWKTSQGSEVKNKTYWKSLVNIVDKFNNIEWCWVKAHSGIAENEKVDTLARNCAELLKEK
jgi:ribonuclease HI